MTKKDKITEKTRKEFSEIERILIDIDRLRMQIKFITNEDESYFKPVIEKSAFFYGIYRDSLKLLIIQLAKLLVNKFDYENKSTKPRPEDFNLEQFILNLKLNFKSIAFKNAPTIEQLDSCIVTLDKISESESFNKFKILRNKFYSHTAKNRSDFEVSYKLDSLWSIINEIQAVFNILNHYLNNTKLMFSYRNPPNEIFMIKKYIQIKDHVNAENRKSPDLGRLQDILNIMRE